MVIIGGEPFVRKGVWGLVEYIVNHGIRLGIATNGTLITKGSLGRLNDLPKDKFFFGISLDGAKPSTHDGLRGSSNAYSRAIRAIGFIAEKGFRLSLQTVLQRDNVGEIEEIAAIATRFGAVYRVIPCIIEKGRGALVYERSSLSIHDILNTAEMLARLNVRGNKARILMNLPPALLPEGMSDKGAMSCFWGTHFCGIMPNGDVALCHGSDFCASVAHMSEQAIAGNIRKCSLSSIWNTSRTFAFLRSISPDQFGGICGKCVVRHYCRGYCRIHALLRYGSLFAPDPLCQWAYEAGLFPRYALEKPSEVEKDDRRYTIQKS